MDDQTLQWVRFSPDAEWPSTDFEGAEWVLVEVWQWPDGKKDLSLIGVEYTMPASAVAEWGPVVPAYNGKGERHA